MPGLVMDFDGTLTRLDVGDALCARFAAPPWRELGARYARGELSLPDAQRQMWALFDADRDQACAYAVEVGALRPGVDALLARAAELGYARVLASGGFDFYIEAILGPARLRQFDRVICNRAVFEGRRVTPHFAEGLACARCAVCKGEVVAGCGPGSVFVGDGHSDTCVIGAGARLFAVEGERLHRAAVAQGAEVTPFRDLFEVAAALPPIVRASSGVR